MVGVDGSERSRQAARAAAETAHQRIAPLRLVRVVRAPGAVAGTDDGDLVPTREAARELQVLADLLAADYPGLTATAVLHPGQVGRALVEESAAAERVVLGGRPPGEDPGQVVAEVAYLAHSRVLVHRGGTPGGPVVVGVDCSPGSAGLMQCAVAEAGRRGAALVVVHGRPTWLRPAPGQPGTPEGRRARRDTDRVVQRQVELLGDLVERARLGRPDLQIDVVLADDDPPALLRAAAADAQLLVLGRRSWPDRTTLPTTAALLLRTAPCPVLLCPVTAGPAVPHADRVDVTHEPDQPSDRPNRAHRTAGTGAPASTAGSSWAADRGPVPSRSDNPGG